MQKILSKKARASVVALALVASIFSAPTAEALYKVIPATQWGHIYAGTTTLTKPEQRAPAKSLQAKSKIEVNEFHKKSEEFIVFALLAFAFILVAFILKITYLKQIS